VILNPHNGGATRKVRGASAASVARRIVTMLNGGRAPGLLNPEIYTDGYPASLINSAALLPRKARHCPDIFYDTSSAVGGESATSIMSRRAQ
jgi:hypothetical protein